tara:strand:+ start:97 stop:423 length:327 start_codon:yes stop_codon:yes gene_type:complete
MIGLKIKTNNVPRNLLYGYELTAKEAEDFDYIDKEDFATTDFAKYKGNIYHIGDMMSTHGEMTGMPILCEAGWSGYEAETMWSGIVLRYADAYCETVVMGSFYTYDKD